ncbi:hypothetical protein M231_02632 [Tremella mesenterica]|uniref:CCHC-type domain-containing protein n=1 Tax=Tremella mesenterica TaxID=5217 RepID=A0A4Q1BQG5_TREME|nr:hypothetical protein M231_02632 [Tremella mesenterica]
MTTTLDTTVISNETVVEENVTIAGPATSSSTDPLILPYEPSETLKFPPVVLNINPTLAAKGKIQAEESYVEEKEDTLLLPGHVTLTSPPGSDRGDENEDMEGLHFVDDDVAKGVPRYFDTTPNTPQTEEAAFLASATRSKICQNCKRPGHRMNACPHTICTLCGKEDDHERRFCPIGLVCFNCGQRGHRISECEEPSSKTSRRHGCAKCGSRDHMAAGCPSVWRVYSYLSKKAREASREKKARVQGWAKEAVGGDAYEEWCYNCAQQGHLGDDCPYRRGSVSRLTVPSAFSRQTASRGPYGSIALLSHTPRSTATPTHNRFRSFSPDESPLPFLQPSNVPLEVGRKSKEKTRQRLQALANEQSISHDSDIDDWFDRPRHSSTLKPSDGVGQSRGKGEEKEDTAFSHKRFMSKLPSSGPRMIFGHLTGPGLEKTKSTSQNSKPPNRHEGSPGSVPKRTKTPLGRVKEQDHRPPSPLSETGDKKRSGENGVKRRKSKDKEKDRDWEGEWRAKGFGGGSVIGWDEESDIDVKARGGKDTTTQPHKTRQRYRGGY